MPPRPLLTLLAALAPAAGYVIPARRAGAPVSCRPVLGSPPAALPPFNTRAAQLICASKSGDRRALRTAGFVVASQAALGAYLGLMLKAYSRSPALAACVALSAATACSVAPQRLAAAPAYTGKRLLASPIASASESPSKGPFARCVAVVAAPFRALRWLALNTFMYSLTAMLGLVVLGFALVAYVHYVFFPPKLNPVVEAPTTSGANATAPTMSIGSPEEAAAEEAAAEAAADEAAAEEQKEEADEEKAGE